MEMETEFPCFIGVGKTLVYTATKALLITIQFVSYLRDAGTDFGVYIYIFFFLVCNWRWNRHKMALESLLTRCVVSIGSERTPGMCCGGNKYILRVRCACIQMFGSRV